MRLVQASQAGRPLLLKVGSIQFKASHSVSLFLAVVPVCFHYYNGIYTLQCRILL